MTTDIEQRTFLQFRPGDVREYANLILGPDHQGEYVKVVSADYIRVTDSTMLTVVAVDYDGEFG